MPSPEKFRETPDDFEVGQKIIDEMHRGFDGIVPKTNKKIKSAFSGRRMRYETVLHNTRRNPCLYRFSTQFADSIKK